jgi:hypothetical protein
MGPVEDYHQRFHSILGHLTTIRSVIAVLEEDYKENIPPEIQQMVTAASQHCARMVTEIEELRTKLYSEIDHGKNTDS